MASEVKTNKVSPATSTTLNVGDAGDTLALAVDAVTGLKVGSDAAGDVLYNDGTDYTRLAKPGTPAGEVLTFATSATAPSWVAAAGGGFSRLHIPSAGVYTVPADITKIVVAVQGAGGGGAGGAASVYGSGGGGGGYAIKSLAVSATDTMDVLVGASGTAGTASGSGATGGTSSFAQNTGATFTTVQGLGGVGGVHNGAAGVGGVPSGGDIMINGQTAQGGGAGEGMGGHSVFGFPAQTKWGNYVPDSPVGYGSGGTGAYSYALAASAGAAGLVVIWEYK